jgi:hypothetical protein
MRGAVPIARRKLSRQPGHSQHMWIGVDPARPEVEPPHPLDRAPTSRLP